MSFRPATHLSDKNKPYISLVFPIFNEEAVLPVLLPRLDAVVEELERDFGPVEAVFVNDGSRDRSLSLLRNLAETRPVGASARVSRGTSGIRSR
jgi:glycosyltransferase involved in cell wall biosynthesis